MYTKAQIIDVYLEILLLKLNYGVAGGVAGRGYIHNHNCFGTATQLRRGKAILQHGSIRLEPDAKLFTQVFDNEPFNLTQLPFTQQGKALI